MSLPPFDPMTIAVRAFATKADKTKISTPSGKRLPRKQTPPSVWSLIFDTETTTDGAQNLRFGTYQVRHEAELKESGIFYNQEEMKSDDVNKIKKYCASHQLTCRTVSDFVDEIFYLIGYQYRGTIIGFNLPFDISRLAIEHSSARSTRYNKIMRGGFSFKLTEHPDFQRVQIKHISSRDAFIQFTAPRGQRNTRGQRKKKKFQPVRRGFFIDVKTIAAALTSQSHSLDSLAKYLKVTAQKQHTDEHGSKLTNQYIEYAVQDTQATWECFEALQSMYAQHGLTQTELHKIHSEASLGKAYLREMGIQPWRKLQPDFPEELLGYIMSAYYGGRSEVHIRKEPVQVLYCDFLSMYPTVCTLMGLWQFVTAKGMEWEDSTTLTQEFLKSLTIDDLQNKETWRKLSTLVQVEPDADIFPVRAKYGGDAQYTIGLNYLTSESPLWYTLADCIASKILTGKVPKIIKAITFTPKEIQEDLQPVEVAGDADYQVDPNHGDFFKKIIDLRQVVKSKMKSNPKDRGMLNSKQLSLKILANSTSYGIFVELNVEKEKLKQPLTCYGHSDVPKSLDMNKFEMPGLYFHPLLATLITGAARLMLAITENLTVDAGLDWAFCDTDSMALAKPDTMSNEIFYEKAETIIAWFESINPYEQSGSILKIEDENYSQRKPERLETLYCHAISSKRYALFNLNTDNKPILRKVSEHGLGHLLAPYDGDTNWKNDLWLEIIQASQEQHQPNFKKLDLDKPAISRYGATSPELLSWFKHYNQDNSYSTQVRPFNFLLSLQPKHDRKQLKPASSYSKNIVEASAKCFDRQTGESINKQYLKTYHEALAQYHLHPETKFLNGDYLDKGKTNRRHINLHSIQYIGKEANKWEEQYILGYDVESQIEYGTTEKSLKVIIDAIKQHGFKVVSQASKLSIRHLHNIYHEKTALSKKTSGTLLKAISIL